MPSDAQPIGTARTAGPPVHETVYRELKAHILYGEMAPGEGVTIQGLTQRLEAGMTPVREAIRRLIAEGALELHDNRRVSVPVLSATGIAELTVARDAIEPELARRAALQTNAKSIAELTQIDDDLDEAIRAGDVRGYLVQNHAFHDRLYDMANAPILQAVAGGLWLRFGPSLRVVCGRLGTANLPDKHKDILRALATGDGDAAAKALQEDITQGMEQIRAALGDPPTLVQSGD